MVKRVRVWSVVSPDLDKKLIDWSERMGVTKSQLINIAIQAGLSAVTKAVSPEDAISPEVLAKIMIATQNLGVDIKDLKND